MLTAIIGYIMIGLLIYLLLKGKASPIVVFLGLPVIASIILGYSVAEINEMLKAGISSVTNVALLAGFSALYFSILADLGTLNPFVDFLLKKAKGSVVGITVATALLATVINVEGSVTASILVCIPALMPIYKRYNIRLVVLFTIIGAAGGVMNMSPWAGPLMRLSAVTSLDPQQMWMNLLPVQIALAVAVVVLAVYLGVAEKKRGAGLSAGTKTVSTEEGYVTSGMIVPKPRFYFNVMLTIVLIAGLFFPVITSSHLFMFATAILLAVNYRGLKDQGVAISKHAAAPFSVIATIMSAGMLVGMFAKTPVLTDMAGVLLAVVPDFLGPYLHIVLAFVSLPLGVVVGFDAFVFGIIPLAIEVGKNFGISPEAMGQAMLIGKNLGIMLQFPTHVPFLAISFLGGELKDYWGFAFKYMAILTTLGIIFAIAIGLMPI
ncbi:SLC13 family permease [Desulfitobacterium hafniense]|uniref:SLC13 family permease n=1 Tax=Desulfitobacterium hafniense TaxID=49338 RepID=UPI000362F5B6|nr:SLC13 family permease [Desulfitobacterium hafniense]